MLGLSLTRMPAGDEAGLDDDDDDVSGASFPSNAPTGASGLPGDLDIDDVGADEEIHIRPNWQTDLAPRGGWLDGVWGAQTRGRGETVLEQLGWPRDELPETRGGGEGRQEEQSGKSGALGVFCGNLGGHWADRCLNDHMMHDIKSSPAHILTIQEAEADLLLHLKEPPADGVRGKLPSGEETRGDGEEAAAIPPGTRGSVAKWRRRPTSQFWGIRGPEAGKSLMICARKALVQGVRLLLFRRRVDGKYKAKTGRRKPRKEKVASSRLMVVACKMRHFRIYGDGGTGPAELKQGQLHGSGEQGQLHGSGDELIVMTIHLHCMTAKKDVTDGSRSMKKFWDEMAQHILEFGVRLVTGDFKMALWTVIPELRARGFQANLAAWYPWKHVRETAVRMDSCAIIVIGPCAGLRRLWDPSVLGAGIAAAELPKNWANVEEISRDEDGREVARSPWEIPEFNFMAQGYSLVCYRPTDDMRRRTCVTWSFKPVTDVTESAMAEVLEKTRKDKAMFPIPIDNIIGLCSWRWPSMSLCKQKPVDVKLFDPEGQFLREGSHMPLLIFIGLASEGRRTPAAQSRREEKAARRGWRRERIGKGKGKTCGGGVQTQTRARSKGKTCGGGVQTQTSTGQPLDYDRFQTVTLVYEWRYQAGDRQREGDGQSRAHGGWLDDANQSRRTRGGGDWHANWRDDANQSRCTRGGGN